MTHPGGRPRKLTPLMELRIYETITATRIGKRVFACVDLARELGIGVSTVQRILTQQRRAHLARITTRFLREPHNSISESPR